MSRPLLELRGIRKGYPGNDLPVLEHVDLEVAEGEFAAIVGCSGSGKTTLVSMMAGLTQPDRGQIWLDGKAMPPPGPDRAVVFQNYSLLPWFSVLENVRLGVRAAAPDLSAQQVTERAERFIDLVKLTPAIAKRPRELSGGMRQRVALARALAMEPRVLLMDEPLSALDALTRATLQDELARIRSLSASTIVLVTNDIDEAILLADTVHPLTRTVPASLGQVVRVEMERPRLRRQLSLAPGYQQARKRIVAALARELPTRRAA